MLRPSLRRARAALLCTAVLSAVAACTRDAPPPRVDSVVATPPASPAETAVAAPASVAPTWDAASAGPALFVPGDTAELAVASAVLPDVAAATASDSALAAATTPLDGAALDLFALRGKVGTARVAANARTAYAGTADCALWPSVRLSARGAAAPGTTPAGGPAGPASSDGAALPLWSVAFAAGRAGAIAVDSLEGLSSADSAARAADVARLASLLPRTNTKEFAGLPFAVRRAGRFTQGGIDVLVGEAVRKIPQEANPREQHVLVVGERAAGSRDKFEPAYHETSAGDETDVETRDIVAAVTLGRGAVPTIVLNREYGDAFAYSLIERTGPKRWRLRWTSATLGCDAGS